MTSPAPDPELRAAFLATLYGPPGERMRLSPVPGPAPRWAHGPWAIVTAWNPDAQHIPDAENHARQGELLAAVTQAGFSPRSARNGSGEWAEDSLLIPGASLEKARCWGETFRQKAVLWGSDSQVNLIWLPGPVERCWAVLVTEP